jgi:RNA-dependent RNA polymerase
VHRLINANALTSYFLPVAPHNEGEGAILTDGCGFINGAALTLIAQRLSLPCRPTAVQGRVAGAKGLWILHGQDRSLTEPPRIWIRKSQQKIKHPSLERGSAHVIFDLVSQSTQITVPAHLNSQTIINLAENGVNFQVFEDLLHDGLTEVFSSLTRWDGPSAMPLLWNVINNLGSVTRTRLQRVAHGLSRAIGLANRFEMDREDDDDDVDDEESFLENDDGDRSLHGTVLELIQAGFSPKSFFYLHEKMRVVVGKAMDRHLQKYRLEVRQSAQAFIVPGVYANIPKAQPEFQLIFCRPFRRLGGRGNLFQVVSEVRRPINRDERVLRSGACSCKLFCGRWRHLTLRQVSRNPTMVASDIQKVINDFALDFCLTSVPAG